jgi:hypothetical protein
MSAPWHSTWTRMRGDWMDQGLTRRQVKKLLVDEQIAMGIWEVKPVLKAAGLWPPPKHYGVFAYQPEHIEAVRAYADREGLVARKVTHGLAAG